MVTFKGNPVRLIDSFPKVGEKAPDFVLVDTDLQDRSLKDFPGKKLLVIAVSIDTPVCSISGKKFQEIAGKKGVTVLLITSDLPFAQKRYCGAEGMANIKTLSLMRNQSFAKDYGVLIQEGPLRGVCCRAVLLLDEKDEIIYAELVQEITQEPDYKAFLDLI